MPLRVLGSVMRVVLAAAFRTASGVHVGLIGRAGLVAFLLFAISATIHAAQEAGSSGQPVPNENPTLAPIGDAAPNAAGAATGNSLNAASSNQKSTPPGGAQRAANEKAASSSQPEKSQPAVAPTGAGAAETPRTIQLPDDGGGRISVPLSASVREYLEFVRSRDKVVRPRPANSAISSITLTGDVLRERCELTAVLKIQVLPEKDWVHVPLQMQRATLLSSTHTGPGRFVDGSDDSGLGAWLQGAGEHVLTLRLFIPLKTQLSVHELQLGLPLCATTSLKLKIDSPRAAARIASPRSTLSQQVVDNTTEVTVIGLGSTVNLSWQIDVETPAADVVTESLANLLVNVVEGESVSIDATQRIVALQGQFDTLQVQLPSGFELVQLTGNDVASHDLPSNTSGLCTVRLKRSSAGPVELRWIVRAKFPPPGTPLVIDGFEVRSAAVQTGYIGIGLVGDIRATRLVSEDRYTERMNVADLPAVLQRSQAGQGQLSSAFHFLRQPFRLVLAVQRVEPLISSRNTYGLHVNADSAELLAEFDLQVIRGNVRDIVFRWPGFNAAKWILQPVDSSQALELIEEPNETEAGQSDLLRLRFASPLQGRCRLLVSARCGISASGPPVDLMLPECIGTTTSTSLLQASAADQVDLRVEPVNGDGLSELQVSTAGTWLSSEESLPQNRLSYRILNGSPAVRLHVGLRAPELRVQPVVQIHVVDNGLRVVQHFDYTARNQRVNQLRFELRGPLEMKGLSFASVGGGELPLIRRPLPESSGTGLADDLRVSLEQPTTGQFSVEASYFLPLESLGQAFGPSTHVATVPLLVPVAADMQPWTCDWTDTRGVLVTCNSPEWRSIPGNPFRFQYAARATVTANAPKTDVASRPNAVRAIDLAITAANPDTVRPVAVDPVIVSARLDATGNTLLRLQADVRAQFPVIRFSLDPTLSVSGVWWNGTPGQTRSWVDQATGQQVLELPIPDSATPARSSSGAVSERLNESVPSAKTAPTSGVPATGSRSVSQPLVLTVDFRHAAEPVSRGIDRRHIPMPAFGSGIEVGSCFLELLVPEQEHLFSEIPWYASISPWRFNGLYFSRRPALSATALASLMRSATTQTPPSIPDISGQHRYLFQRTGSLKPLTIQLMSLSAVVLCGAGMSLVVGLMLLRWPAARHSATALLGVVVVAGVGVWFPESVCLLLQPAALGGVLALFAAQIDAFAKRGNRSPSLTISPDTNHQYTPPVQYTPPAEVAAAWPAPPGNPVAAPFAETLPPNGQQPLTESPTMSSASGVRL